MVRRGNQRMAKKHSNTPAIQPAAVSTPALTFGPVGAGSGNTSNVGLRQYGMEDCPQCGTPFNNSNVRPVQEACGHVKCRSCFINNDDGCPQCKEGEQQGEASSKGMNREGRSSRNDDGDLMPPLLTVEEPLVSSLSSGPGLLAGGQMKDPPVLSSSFSKPPLKRKPSKEFNTSAPKVQKTTSSRSSTTATEADQSGRPKSRRPSTSVYARPELQRSPANRFVDELEGEKRRNRLDAKKSTHTAGADDDNAQFGDSPAATSPRIHSRRKSLGSASGSTASKKWSQPPASPPGDATRKDVSTPIFSFASQGAGGNSPPFSVSITSTKNKTADTYANLDEEEEEEEEDEEEMPGSSSNDGSNSNSLETLDPLYIRGNEWVSDLMDGSSNSEFSLKKKRNPVEIHQHITVLKGESLLYQCNVCMKKFKTKAHIKYHEFCKNGEKPFKCEQCGQGFIAKSHYEYHLRTHTGERPYVCPKCGKGFNQRGKVTRHMRSHTGEKPFICQQCGRGFANAQALRSHFLIHTGERPFACQYCNKRFTGMTNLKKHVITHTGERPFQCTHCGKSFGLKWTLDLHLRTHSTERPYACDQCTRAFSNSKDLRRHLVIHSGERPFKCWICGTAFRRKDNLDRHIKNTHNQPKEVAKQLANEAAAEYLAQTKNNPSTGQSVTMTVYPKKGSTIYSVPKNLPPSGSSGEGPVAGTSRGSFAETATKSEDCDEEEEEEVTVNEDGIIITADLSPPVSPNPDIGAGDVYVLPNGLDAKEVDPVIDNVMTETSEGGVGVQVFDGLAELRTVPVSEYHQLEGIKLLEKAKSSSGTSRMGNKMMSQNSNATADLNVKKNQKSTGNDLLFDGTTEGPSSGSNFNHGLTVTVVYENDGKTHFITDQPAPFSSNVSPLNFSSTQMGIGSIVEPSMFSLGPNEPPADEEYSGPEDAEKSPERRDIQLKKSETILTGNLSKFLQMDVSKSITGDAHVDVDSSAVAHEVMGKVSETHALRGSDCAVSELRGAVGDINQIRGNTTEDFEDTIKEEKYVDESVAEPNSFADMGSGYPEPSLGTSKKNFLQNPSTGSEKIQKPLKRSTSIDDSAPAQMDVAIVDVHKTNDQSGPVLIFKHEIDDDDFGKEKHEDLVVTEEKNSVHQRLREKNASVAARNELVAKDSNNRDNALNERSDYSSDPMFQESVTDDDEKLQQSTVCSDHPMEISHGSAEKETVDSILPEGIDSFDSPEALFQDKIVNSSHKLEDKNAPSIMNLKEIVDKECPASILQDDISDSEGIDTVAEVAQNSTKKFKKQPSASPDKIIGEDLCTMSQNKNVITVSEDFVNPSQKPSKLFEKLLEDKKKMRERERDSISDAESISSAEFEEICDDRKSRREEFKGVVDKECPQSILQGDEESDDDLEEGEIGSDSEVEVDVCDTVSASKRDSGDSSRAVVPHGIVQVAPTCANLETEPDVIADHTEKKAAQEINDVSCGDDVSDAESISDNEFDDSRVARKSTPELDPLRNHPKARTKTRAILNNINESLQPTPVITSAPSEKELSTSTVSGQHKSKNAYNSDKDDVQLEGKHYDNSISKNNVQLESMPLTTAGNIAELLPAPEKDRISNWNSISGDPSRKLDSELEEEYHKNEIIRTDMSLTGIQYGKNGSDSSDTEDSDIYRTTARSRDTDLCVEDDPENMVSNVRSMSFHEALQSDLMDETAKSPFSTSHDEPKLKFPFSIGNFVNSDSPDPRIHYESHAEAALKMSTCSRVDSVISAASNLDREHVDTISSESRLVGRERGNAVECSKPVTHSYSAAQVGDSKLSPSEARLVYTNSSASSSLHSSLHPCNYSQSNVTPYSAVGNMNETEKPESNYGFAYEQNVSSAVSTSHPQTRSSFRFVYANGDPVTETDPLDHNMRIVYACAAATADPHIDSSAGPQKLKLLYAEALGVAAPDNSGQLQLVYTSTAPNQNVVRAPNQNVHIYSPTTISADSRADAENLQQLFAQQSQMEPSSNPVPVEVLYNGNGTVMAQTVGHPQDLSWIKRDLNHTFVTQSNPYDKELVPSYPINTRAPIDPRSTRELNHHNYASNPYLGGDSSKRIKQLEGPFEGEPDGLRTLAKAAATRMFSIQADADATTRAAAAIAAVGRDAQIKRQREILERNNHTPPAPPIRGKGENVPHRGPRKKYLSQLTTHYPSRK